MNWFTAKTVGTIVAASLAAGTGAYLVQQQASNRLRYENQTLASANIALSNERDAALSTATANNDELERLRKEKGELLRLRGEVGALRKRASEVIALKEEKAQLHAALSKQSEKEAEPTAAAQTNFPKDSWAFTGYATPEAALQSWTWAYSKGDQKIMLECLSPQEQPKYESEFAKTTQSQFAAECEKSSSTFKGYQIVNRHTRSDLEIDLAVVITTTDGQMTPEQKYKMIKMGNDWKMAGPSEDQKALLKTPSP